jgi:hypothetical protein
MGGEAELNEMYLLSQRTRLKLGSIEEFARSMQATIQSPEIFLRQIKLCAFTPR